MPVNDFYCRVVWHTGGSNQYSNESPCGGKMKIRLLVQENSYFLYSCLQLTFSPRYLIGMTVYVLKIEFASFIRFPKLRWFNGFIANAAKIPCTTFVCKKMAESAH
ncbi:hypothetical protein Tcan_00189 [Toxocara canis]|uniref:Uncharacterized protein n=1 Tax=Toxocara canis TaxID=6265 RepID=A0A0B2UWZ3_TOXCA|nr:hypothetical protein Tcan_00189 [Toxocara canis]